MADQRTATTHGGCQMAAQPDQDDLAARTRRATHLRGQVQAALRRARDAHQRAVGVHERAAAFYVAVGDLPAAEREKVLRWSATGSATLTSGWPR